MKKITALLLSGFMLLMLFGCISEAPGGAYSAEELSGYGEGYDFDIHYAKTPEYFYAFTTTMYDGLHEGKRALERIRLDDFNQHETIPLPAIEEFNGYKIVASGYDSAIVGITSKWLFVSIVVIFDDSLMDVQLPGYLIYRMSHDGKQYAYVDASDSRDVIFNSAGSALCYATQTDDNITIEVYDLLTGAKKPVFEGSLGGDFWRWGRTQDGNAVLLTGGETFAKGECVVIDSENNAIPAVAENLKLVEYPDDPPPANEAERQLSANGDVLTFSSHGQWVYYVEYDRKSSNDLYRVKTDGSGKKKLRAKTHIYSLLTVGNKLYALASYDTGNTEGMSTDRVELHQLDADGKPVSTTEIGFSNENTGFSMREFNGKMLVEQHIIYGGLEFAALYDPATGLCLQGMIADGC